MSWIRLTGPAHTLEVFGIRLVGISGENAVKLLLTVVMVVLAVLIARVLHVVVRRLAVRDRKAGFWARQGANVITAALILIGVVSVWFDDPTRLTTALGLVTAGLAFALQRVVTALAGYLLILRGSTFTVGDRIVMGGVRGDVIALGFLQTTIMEMGQPPPVQGAPPAMWVQSRQYTGRLVTVSNAQVFNEPVYNYTREFPFIWEEISLPVSYQESADTAERILLDAARRHTQRIEELSRPELQEIERRYGVQPADLHPRVYYRLTDNWLELTVRFIAKDHDIRSLKDRMSRDILRDLTAAGMGVASATFEVVGVPPLRLTREETHPTSSAAKGSGNGVRKS